MSRFRRAFDRESRERAAQFMARSDVDLRPRPDNGHTERWARSGVVVDPRKLARFDLHRARVGARVAAEGGLAPRRAHQQEILAVENLSIHFGGVHALTSVDLTANTGEVAAVIGPNGAGKTTLFNCLSGLLTPDSGRVSFDGRALKGAPAVRGRRGLGRTFQTPRLFRSLSVEENLVFGCRTADSAKRRYTFDPGLGRLAQRDRAERVAHLVGFRGDLSATAGSLPFGDLRTVELARALCGAPTLLMLDEPASGLDVEQAEEFVALLRTLSELGLAILLIEHDMHLVMDVCQRITVLDFGQVIAKGTPLEVQANEAVIEAYLGRSD